MRISSRPLPLKRKTPAREGSYFPKYTEHIFVTCCTRGKTCVLDNQRVHSLLQSLWRDRSHWSTIRYVIMPDYVHLMVFASHGCTTDLRGWAAWWKSKVTRELGYNKGALWLPDLWDTRMRTDGHIAAKLAYMKENPVRAGLVTSAEFWPFQGDLIAANSDVP